MSTSVGLSLKKTFLKLCVTLFHLNLYLQIAPLLGGINHLLACIKIRNRHFHKAKKLNSCTYTSLYRICSNKTLSYQQKLKASFFHFLALHTQVNLFCLYSRNLQLFLTETHNGLTASDPISKANMIKDFFCQCFNSSVPSFSISDSICSPDLLCTPDTITQLISQLPTITSPGHDEYHQKCSKLQHTQFLAIYLICPSLL